MVTINAESAFTGSGDKIHLITSKVLLRAAIRDFSKLKKLCNWADLNVILLPPFLTKAVILEVETAAEELLKAFSNKIVERVLESATKELEDDSARGSDEDNNKDANVKTTEKAVAMRDKMEKFASNCDDILTLLQAVAVKSS